MTNLSLLSQDLAKRHKIDLFILKIEKKILLFQFLGFILGLFLFIVGVVI